MTIDELIKHVDKLLPGNRFDNDMKTQWLSEIDGKLFEEIIFPAFPVRGTGVQVWHKEGNRWVAEPETENELNYTILAIDPLDMMYCCERPHPVGELRPYRYTRDRETELIAQDRFCDVYAHYLLAKMHSADGEIDEYNNEVLLYQAAFNDFAGWHLRNFRR